jgi:hypothetical protein
MSKSKFFITVGAVAALAVPSAALADSSPVVDGWQFKDNTSYDQSNLVGRYDAQITHNGWSVGGNKHMDATSVSSGGDQTTSPGSRADQVQTALGH